MTAKEAPPLVSGSEPQTVLGRIAGLISLGGLGGAAWVFKDALEPTVKAVGDGLAHVATADPLVAGGLAGVAAIAGGVGYVRYRLRLRARDILRERAATDAVRYEVLAELLRKKDVAYFTAHDFEDELARKTSTSTERWDETSLHESADKALKSLVEQKSIEAPNPMWRNDSGDVALYYTFRKPESVPN